MNGSSSQPSATTSAMADQVSWRLTKCELELDTTRIALFAHACAEHVLRFYQVDFSTDDRPRKALEAIGTWLTAPSASASAVFDKALDAAQAASDSAFHSGAFAAYFAAIAAIDAAKAARFGAAGLASMAAVNAVNAASSAVAGNATREARAELREARWQLNKLRELLPEISDLDESTICQAVCDSISNRLTGGWAVQDTPSDEGNGFFRARAWHTREEARQEEILGFGTSAFEAMMDLWFKAN
jgi:hypothetical protein